MQNGQLARGIANAFAEVLNFDERNFGHGAGDAATGLGGAL